MKYVIFTLQEMTPEPLKQNPITVHPSQKPDTDEGESIEEEEESTTSSDMSEQDSESDTTVDDTQDHKKSQSPETLHIHNVCNTTMHDEDESSEPVDDSSEENSTADISTETTEEPKPTETSQVLTVFNKTIHHEYDSSEDKFVTEIEPYTKNERKNANRINSLLPIFKLKWETEKLKGP